MEFVNIKEAAEMLGVSRVTIYALIKRGRLRRYKIADRYFLDRGEVSGITVKRAKGLVSVVKAHQFLPHFISS